MRVHVQDAVNASGKNALSLQKSDSRCLVEQISGACVGSTVDCRVARRHRTRKRKSCDRFATFCQLEA